MVTNLLLAATPWASRSTPEQMSLIVHISAGAISIVTGFIALFAAKGAPTHRQAGILFVYAMLVMGMMGATTAALWNRALFVNVPAGLVAAYLVITGLATVRPDSRFAARDWTKALMVVALLVGSYNAYFGVVALTNETHRVFGLPPFPYVTFGIVGLLCAYGDLYVLRNGPRTGAARLGRHLWRMSWALFIAAGSFFLGQAKVIPKPIRILPLLAIPPLLVIVAMIYWLWRVRLRKSMRGLFLARATEPAGAV